MGQQNQVTVVRMVTRGTVDEHIHQRQKQKTLLDAKLEDATLSLIDAFLEGDNALPGPSVFDLSDCGPPPAPSEGPGPPNKKQKQTVL